MLREGPFSIPFLLFQEMEYSCGIAGAGAAILDYKVKAMCLMNKVQKQNRSLGPYW